MFFSFSVNLISFSIGTSCTWSSPMIEKLTNVGPDNPFDPPITIEEASWITAIFDMGSIFGPFIYGTLTNRVGRKKAILAIGIPNIIGNVLIVSSKSVFVFYAARFIGGLCQGAIFNLIPVYVGEIASSHNRGALCSIQNLIFCTGMLFTYCVGPYASFMAFNITLLVLPVIFLVVFSIIGIESPYHYVKIGREDLAKKTLEKLRGGSVDVEDEFKLITKSLQEVETGTIFDILSSKELKRALAITLGLMLFQQLSGITAVLFYTQSIFTESGANLEPALCSIIVGIVQLIISCIIPFSIETLGRKKVLIISAIGNFLTLASLGVYSFLKDNNYDVSQVAILPLISLVIYIITYTFGYGPLPWIIMGELFQPKVKSAATLTTASFCFFIAFLIAKYFQTVVTAVGLGVAFLIFTAGTAFSIPFSYLVVIETKGKSLLQITEELAK